MPPHRPTLDLVARCSGPDQFAAFNKLLQSVLAVSMRALEQPRRRRGKRSPTGIEPKTFQDAVLVFANPAACREYLIARRWPDGVECPRCGSRNVLFLERYNRWHCREGHSAPQFTLKTRTIMENSPLGLDKWLLSMWLVANCKGSVSSYEVGRALKITQKTAWFLLRRVRRGNRTK